MAAKMVHPYKLALFVLLSVTDLFLTWVLVNSTDGIVYESNPVASFWLATFGWLGLTAYKMGLMVFVSALVLVISRYRPRVGGRILLFACSALTCVVLYSCFLGWMLDPSNLHVTSQRVVLVARYTN
jgi:hypothetical protein